MNAPVVEQVAAKLGVSPDFFIEYQLWQAQRQFDPREVGEEAAWPTSKRGMPAVHGIGCAS